MRTLCKLILGETWFLPLAIALVLLLAAAASRAAPDAWEAAGGPVLLLGVLGILVAAVRRA